MSPALETASWQCVDLAEMACCRVVVGGQVGASGIPKGEGLARTGSLPDRFPVAKLAGNSVVATDRRHEQGFSPRCRPPWGRVWSSLAGPNLGPGLWSGRLFFGRSLDTSRQVPG